MATRRGRSRSASGGNAPHNQILFAFSASWSAAFIPTSIAPTRWQLPPSRRILFRKISMHVTVHDHIAGDCRLVLFASEIRLAIAPTFSRTHVTMSSIGPDC